jgi:hypothetical protein
VLISQLNHDRLMIRCIGSAVHLHLSNAEREVFGNKYKIPTIRPFGPLDAIESRHPPKRTAGLRPYKSEGRRPHREFCDYFVVWCFNNGHGIILARYEVKGF